MKLKTIFFVILFGTFFVACKNEKSEKKVETKKSLKDFMVGNWETQYIKIEMPTVNKTDSTSVFEDDFSKPNTGRAQSTYNNDGTFSAWFKQPDGKKVGETKGTWKTKGDSLYVDYPYLGKQVQAWYFIKQNDNKFEGKVVYDWDGDGEFDDTLQMKSKRIDL
ncbi:hypothetical protein WH52_13560 [Tenacibaculum holothuriorum]|uniref:Lipocalin-like domain-containing protein n=1 Tax=Tenacibaculum holothuriorum TaxID=1635173 RepID=A0A1Y2P9G1_9FLAO|nr:hypothetical protein [Tenacibaculum holothuriorum]OSY87083.1 hypothetical protein WH52_13560 [Tenacibaculum holothuriorum]